MDIFKIAVYIQAHKEPEKVDILISSLIHDSIDVFLFIDKKVSIDKFIYLKKKYNVQVNHCRVNVFWGGYSQVRNTLDCFRFILSEGVYSHIITLSGECLLIKPIVQLVDYLKLNNKTQFVSLFDLDSEWDFSVRFKHFYFPDLGIRFISKILYLLFFFSKKNRYILRKCYGGSCWFTLTTDCIKYILDYVDNHPEFVKFHKYTICSDEFFIHSIIGNSRFISDIKPYLHYIDWSQKRSSPKNLTPIDLHNILKSGKFFCRKASLELMQMFHKTDTNA